MASRLLPRLSRQHQQSLRQPIKHQELLRQHVKQQRQKLLRDSSCCWVLAGQPRYVAAWSAERGIPRISATIASGPRFAVASCGASRGLSSFASHSLFPERLPTRRNVCNGSSRGSSSTRESRSGMWSPLRAAEPITGTADDLDSSALDLNSLCSSVVKVYSDFTDPNYALPWQMQRQGSSTGSGFIVHPSAGGGERIILTNAHCVAWNNRLHLRKHGSPIKFPARVLAVAHECDLAVLTVDNDEFWEDTQGLLFGEIPALQDGVIVLGYPRGGDNLCITSGVVSRVDVNTYAHSNTALLCVQIDAAINPGNSGGPALKGGRVVGVAFQGCEASAAQNVGYIVPWNVVRHLFIDLSRHRRYTGFPAAGVLFQQLENECMQQKLGVSRLKAEDLPKGITASGILVTATDAVRSRNFLERAKAAAAKLEATATRPEPASKEAAAAEPGVAVSAGPSAAPAPGGTHDVSGGLPAGSPSAEGGLCEDGPLADPSIVARDAIAAVDAAAAAAAAAGKPPPSAAERKALLHEILEQRIGLRPEDVVMAVDGADVAGDGTVHFRGMERVSVSHVISEKFMGETLSLTVLRNEKVQNVLDEFGPKFHERAPSSLLRPLTEVFATVEGEEPIVLAQILASDLTSGYSVRNCLLSTVDGVKVTNLRHLAQLLGIKTPQQQQQQNVQQQNQQKQPPNEFITFVLEEKLQVVLHRGKAEAMLPEILKQHAIHRQTSDNL
ncbi:hypothetical protein EBH_0029460 [Eimeria brunetti]|uniref:Protease Do-like PDZ domain-containing protein n=1 Tax=Eimeria brunetti TaxID=51314 RepID=U6LBW9_9EIME|nr:hypothetical protein EBH_0029460 [Eimeria brunetti]